MMYAWTVKVFRVTQNHAFEIIEESLVIDSMVSLYIKFQKHDLSSAGTCFDNGFTEV